MADPIASISVIITGIKNAYELLKGFHTGKRDFFEKIVRPLHSETESAVKDYYEFFIFLKLKIASESSFLKTSELKFQIKENISTEISEHYLRGKAKRDAIRGIVVELKKSSGHKGIASYCEAVEIIFRSAIDVNLNKMSAGKRAIEILELVGHKNNDLKIFDYARLIDRQITLIENRWVAANQKYALLCLKSYR